MEVVEKSQQLLMNWDSLISAGLASNFNFRRLFTRGNIKIDQLANMSSFGTLLEFGRSSAVLSPGTIGVVALIILWTLYVLISNPMTIKFLTSVQKQATQTQVPRIPKLPEAPDALPFVGNLMPLGGRLNENDSTIYSRWSTSSKYDSAAKELWLPTPSPQSRICGLGTPMI